MYKIAFMKILQLIFMSKIRMTLIFQFTRKKLEARFHQSKITPPDFSPLFHFIFNESRFPYTLTDRKPSLTVPYANYDSPAALLLPPHSQDPESSKSLRFPAVSVPRPARLD